MKKAATLAQTVLFVMICFFVSMALAELPQRHHIPLDADDPGPDIPEVGSSLFDKIFSKYNSDGRMVHDVPFPLSRLKYGGENISLKFVHTLFPFSRSLQRPVNLDYDPLENPRLVVAPSKDAYGMMASKLFMGYVEAKDQLEVISYNDEAGRFEYQIVAEYSSGAPKVFYVSRGKCLTCHQGQAGIFSPPAWEDSSFGSMKELFYEKFDLKGTERQKRQKLKAHLFGAFESDEQIAVIDALVRKSNNVSFDERVWVHGCSNDNKCRLGMLIATLSPQAQGATEFYKYSNEVLATSGFKKQQIRYSSFLTSNDIGVKDVISKFGSIGRVIRTPQALLEIIGNIYRLSGSDNPASRRPEPLSERDLFARISTFSRFDKKLLLDNFDSSDHVLETLRSLYSRGNSIFEKKAINKYEVMRELLREVYSSSADHYNYWLKKPTPEKVLLKAGLNPVFKKRELNLFSRHCQKCHATNLQFPPQFLKGSEEQVLDQFTYMKSKILMKLESNLMPPSPIDRKHLRDSGDYAEMLEFVRSL